MTKKLLLLHLRNITVKTLPVKHFILSKDFFFFSCGKICVQDIYVGL